MLLPFRWLLYAVTGQPTQQPQVDSGGLLERYMLYRRPATVALIGVEATPQIGDVEADAIVGVTARAQIGAISIDIVVSAPKRRGRPKRSRTAIGDVEPDAEVQFAGANAHARIGTPSTRSVIDLTEDELLMVLLACSQFSAKKII